MGRYYSVVFSAVAVTAAQDLFEIVPAANSRVRLHELRLIQTSDPLPGDSELLRVSIKRSTSGSTSGSGGSAPTPQPFESGDPAAGFTSKVNNTTQVTGGTTVVLSEGGWNVLGEYVWSPPIPPDRKPTAVNGERLVVSMTAPADSLTLSGTAIIEEN